MNEENKSVTFLKEYRAHPERYLPLPDRQYSHFDEWEDQVVRNLFWSAGILNGNRPYFAECWKIFLTTSMTVSFSAEGYEHVKTDLVFLLELIQAGLVLPRSREWDHMKARRVTDGNGKPFIAFNFVLEMEGEEQYKQYTSWLGECCGFDELNRLNEGET